MATEMRRRAFLAGGASFAAFLCGGLTVPSAERQIRRIFQTEYLFDDGKSKASITVDRAGEGLTYFAPHNDEKTSVLAAMDVMRQHGGRLVQITHPGKRNLPVITRGRQMLFDPNRMFSEAGIEKTLKRLNKSHTRALHEQIREFAQITLEHLNLHNLHRGVLIGLHNNTEGGYSAEQYVKGKELEKEAADVHLNRAHDPDDFFFVISRTHFDKLKAMNYNVVLQDNENMTDDGSLSVYCAQSGFGYVNVEAQHGHQAVQKQMIESLITIL